MFVLSLIVSNDIYQDYISLPKPLTLKMLQNQFQNLTDSESYETDQHDSYKHNTITDKWKQIKQKGFHQHQRNNKKLFTCIEIEDIFRYCLDEATPATFIVLPN